MLYSMTLDDIGNISTCVEHTSTHYIMHRKHQKHLHVRGAYIPQKEKLGLEIETSPRAWSILSSGLPSITLARNISTCVEHTS